MVATTFGSRRKAGRILLPLSAALCLSFAGVRGDSAGAADQETQKDKPAKVESPPAPAPKPEFQNLRYAENWSSLRTSNRESAYEQLKFIPLNDSGSIYVSLGGQLRLRSESWWAYGFKEGVDDTFGLSRLRVHGDLHLGPHVRFFVEGKSSLAAGRELPGGLRTLDVDTLDLQNGFVELDANEAVGVKLGRQELQYGKQRLVSPLDWANTRRTFDVARGSVKHGGWTIDGFWGMLVPVRKYDFNTSSQGENDLYGIYGTRNLKGSQLQLDVYWLGLSRNSARYAATVGQEDRQTFGSRLGGKLVGSSDFDLEGAFQTGSFGSQDIRAAMFTAQVGYTWGGVSWKPRAYANFDFASGDGDPHDGRLGTFNQLFPLGHAYLGYIDFVGRQNIEDLSLGVAANPTRKVRLTSDLHSFWRASSRDALYNAGGGVVRAGNLGESRSIGQELDLTGRYAFNRYFSGELGYCHFFTGSFLGESGTDAPTNLLYVQLISTF